MVCWIHHPSFGTVVNKHGCPASSTMCHVFDMPGIVRSTQRQIMQGLTLRSTHVSCWLPKQQKLFMVVLHDNLLDKAAHVNWLHDDMQEAGMMASMRHPNVVMYLGVCLQPPCVVTEYCARGSLNDVFKRARATPALAAQLDWGRRLNMVLDAAKGMMYLHSSEPPVIHRDLKSPNLLVDKHWRLKVAARCPSGFTPYSATMHFVCSS